uniref:hypothetical protein n=1 Tax=Pyxidicoccus trucidator TaxID=2709662 RepID=UPI001967E98D
LHEDVERASHTLNHLHGSAGRQPKLRFILTLSKLKRQGERTFGGVKQRPAACLDWRLKAHGAEREALPTQSNLRGGQGASPRGRRVGLR